LKERAKEEEHSFRIDFLYPRANNVLTIPSVKDYQ